MSVGRRTDEDEVNDVARAELRIGGAGVIPDAITAVVDLAPSRFWTKGQQYPLPSGRILKKHSGLWTVSRTSTEMVQAVGDLLAAVEPRLNALRAAAARVGATMTVGLWWDPAARQGGFTLPSAALHRLCELGERIDIYFPG